MSFTQTVIGGGILAVALNAALSLVLPDPTGIVVHGLTYKNGLVTQDRTVLTNEAAFYAQWAAMVVDAQTGDVVPGCMGSGAAPYPSGRKAVTFSLANWTGNPHCTIDSLEPGRAYDLQAVWSWGDDSVSAKQEFIP